VSETKKRKEKIRNEEVTRERSVGNICILFFPGILLFTPILKLLLSVLKKTNDDFSQKQAVKSNKNGTRRNKPKLLSLLLSLIIMHCRT
jgi:hypothetical protein